MLYIYPFVVDYISFGVGYCLLQVVGSPEPQIGNSNSSHAFFFYLHSCWELGRKNLFTLLGCDDVSRETVCSIFPEFDIVPNDVYEQISIESK